MLTVHTLRFVSWLSVFPHIFASYDFDPCGSPWNVVMFVYSPHSPFYILVICFPPYFCILWFVSRWSTLERGNVCLQYTLSVLYLGYLFFSPPYLCILWFVSKWSTLERGNVCLQSTLSVLYLGYLFSPIFLHPMIYIQVVHLRTW